MEKNRREKVRRQKLQVREKGSSVAKQCVFQCFVAPEGAKNRLAKAAGAELAGRMRGEICTPLWREAQVEVQSDKNWQHRSNLRN